jgi:hypothetical protein
VLSWQQLQAKKAELRALRVSGAVWVVTKTASIIDYSSSWLFGCPAMRACRCCLPAGLPAACCLLPGGLLLSRHAVVTAY